MLWLFLLGLLVNSQQVTYTYKVTSTTGATASTVNGFTDDWKLIVCTDTGIECADTTVTSISDSSDGAIEVVYEIVVSAESTAALSDSEFLTITQTNLLANANLSPYFTPTQSLILTFPQTSSSQFASFTAMLESAMEIALELDASQLLMEAPVQSGADTRVTYVFPASYTFTSGASGSTYEVYLRYMSGTSTLNTLTGAFVESMVMFNGDSTISDLQQYQEELRLAWASSLGVSESDVSIVEIGPNGMNAVVFGHVYSYSAAAAMADTDTFYDTWRTELSQIDGLNSILGLTATALTVSMSDISVSGFQLAYSVTEAVSGGYVYWGVAAEGSSPSHDDIKAGLGLCDGSALQSAGAYDGYVNCFLTSSTDYELFVWYSDGSDGGTVTQSFQTGGLMYIPYSYTFVGYTVAEMESEYHNVAAAFATSAGVDVQYVFVGSGTADSDTGAVIQLMFPYTSHTSATTQSSGFMSTFEIEMSKYSGLAEFVSNVATPYASVGGYEYANADAAQAACQAHGAEYNLCTQAQVYTVVYSEVDGFTIPELCYSGYMVGGVVGWYHYQSETSGTTCGGVDGFQSWSPALPGAHCCTGFAEVVISKDVYVTHPNRYAFSSKADAAVACQDMDSDYSLCSKYQIEGLIESADYNYNMCVGGYYEDGSDDETNGFYVASEDDTCQNGQVGWHSWCDGGLCAAHCCLPSYLDDRTMTLYYGSANGEGEDTSSLTSASAFCSSQEMTPNVCSSSQLRAVASAENMNICKAGWAGSDEDSNVGVLGWWQGEYEAEWCGTEGWNDGSFTPQGVAHCCAPYAKAYVETSSDYEIMPTYYSDGFATGGEAVSYCQDAGYDNLCSKGQVTWWALNDEPNLCRSGWVFDDDGSYTVGYYGYSGCETTNTWNTWTPTTPVAHCCMDSVESATVSDPVYVKTGGYEYSTMEDAAAACDGDNGYSLCSAEQLFRVAYEDVDGESDTNICYTGWVSDGVAGWFQQDDGACGSLSGWRTWMYNGNLAGAHCCTDFEGSTITVSSWTDVTTTEAATTAAPETCLWLQISGSDPTFDGFYLKDGTSNDKHSFTGQNGGTLYFDSEVWIISVPGVGGTFQMVARGTVDGEYPPTLATWDFVEDTTVNSYANVNALCATTMYYIIPTVTGLVTGQQVTLTNSDGSSIVVGYPATSGTFTTAYAEGMDYSVAVDDSCDSNGENCATSSTTTCSIEMTASGTMPVDPSIEVVCVPSTVNVGGSTSGLGTSTVILYSSLGQEQIYSISSNNDWHFLTQFAIGESYNVIVTVQPDGQTCSVENGSGTVEAEVDDITITCVDNQYYVTVNVYGLAVDGTSTAVLYMGGDVITTFLDGEFQFPTALGFGADYVVTANTPDGYSCTLSNNLGTVAGNVDDVVLNCVELVGTSYSVEITFLNIRNCVFGNSIQISEWAFYGADGARISYDGASSTPSVNPDHGDEGVDNIYDGNTNTKWLDYTMGTCGNSLLVDGITLDTEPTTFNFATANDEPNRDPTEFNMQICTMVQAVTVSCKTIHYILEDLTEDRGVYLDTPFSLQSYDISVRVYNNLGNVVVQNMENMYGDALTFTQDEAFNTLTEQPVKTFLYQVYQGSSYKVEVSEHPDGQTCIVTGVYTGTMTDDISLSIYCAESCDVPEYVGELVAAGFPESLTTDDSLCVIEGQYYWKNQALCVSAADDSDKSEDCDYNSMVCSGPLGRTMGNYTYQVQSLLEVFGADQTCVATGEKCVSGIQDCCDPYSECLWTFDASNIDDNQGFASVCTPCADCYQLLNECDEICTRDQSDPLFHPRCPPSTCEVDEDAFSPEYFEDDVEYCLSGGYYHMNGMDVCVNTTTWETQQEQNVQLETNFYHDFEFGTDQCAPGDEKSFQLLLQDHIYISQIRVEGYQNVTTYAKENCCLAASDVSEFTADWSDDIQYLEEQLLKYGTTVQNDLLGIISKLESLQTLLSQLS